MGYFNYFVKCVIRKFVNFIFNKKNFFKFCCILFFVFVITKMFLQTPISYGATTTIGDTTYYDGYNANINLYNKVIDDLILRIQANKNQTLANNLVNFLNNSEYDFICYYGNRDGSNNVNSIPVDNTNLHVIFFSKDIDRTVTSLNWNNNGNITCSSITSNSPVFRFQFVNDILYYAEDNNVYTYVFPSYLFDYKSDNLINFLIDYFKISNDVIGEIIQESTNTIVESNQQTQNTIKEQTEFLTNNTISDDSFALPEDNTNDTTGVDDEINFIFDDIMNAFTDTSSNNSITLTFPFTSQTFDISYASVYNGVFENNNSMAYLKRIIQLGYWYIVAAFVVKDISNKVNKVKTGDIDKIQIGNIKEDLL